ncbi:MAG TPA: TIGR03067 domain-containing protein [Gemmataceae bacterium]|jgi:uncharacterized protein (TIGR03067 family)|nr:TIGR03067 domain-containing protein [Gemmataceae bacterium]
MSRYFCLGLFVCGMLTAGKAPADDPKAPKPDTVLEGTWTLVNLEWEGRKISDEDLVNGTMTIKANKYVFKMQKNENDEEGTLKIDAGKKPATIDLDILTGRSKGKKQVGIYELDGTSLRFCFSDPGEMERPKEFKAGEGSKQTLFGFKKKP